MDAKLALRKCPECNAYTMKVECTNCKNETVIPKPARYSPEDKYGHYRRKLKKRLNIEPGRKPIKS
ncbi:MAG: RNA-protein complex protein Nop10 [Thermoplasmata archaeon]|nr:MAG: RNA-protein complex protein Nop10 [Thermoplasmata archaeon]